MAVNLNLAPAQAVDGVELVTLAAGIKKDSSPDFVVVRLAEGSQTAGVFTQSLFAAAPVELCRQHLKANSGKVRALMINSGNANAGTGEPGLAMARGFCAELAKLIDVPEEAVLPFSTGVIGQLLPEDKVSNGIIAAVRELDEASASQAEHWIAAANGIMTTDTQPKITSKQIQINSKPVTITGMAKGAGMIQPNMATMLSYVFTDAAIPYSVLQPLLASIADRTFNAITVDSDTSTNDSFLLTATGQGVELDTEHSDWNHFAQTLEEVCLDLAQAIIRDAEGASKFITVTVANGKSVAQCKQVAYAIANSPLVKTAMFASDANVGRLLMAIGKCGDDTLDAARIKVSIGDVVAFENAGIAEGYTEERGAAVMAREEITVTIELGIGQQTASVYTSDLSHDYVSINADYRS